MPVGSAYSIERILEVGGAAGRAESHGLHFRCRSLPWYWLRSVQKFACIVLKGANRRKGEDSMLSGNRNK